MPASHAAYQHAADFSPTEPDARVPRCRWRHRARDPSSRNSKAPCVAPSTSSPNPLHLVPVSWGRAPARTRKPSRRIARSRFCVASSVTTQAHRHAPSLTTRATVLAGSAPGGANVRPDYAQSSSGSLSVEKSDPLGQKATAEPVRKRNQTPGGTPDLRGKAAVFLQHELVESGAGAPTLGSGGDSGAFVPGLSPAPIVTFPAPALRTRRADFRHRALQWDHAPRTRTARAIWACRWSADAARLPLCIPTPSPARRRACSRLDNIEPVRFDSLTYACDASGIIALIAGSRHRHSRRPSSFRHRSTPEVPFLDRHYPASSVVRTSPPPRPAQPAPHGVPVGACHTTDRASRVAPIPLFHACRRQYPGGTSRCACRSLPGQWQPSPTYRRVGSRIPGFEACSAFTRVAARMVAGSP